MFVDRVVRMGRYVRLGASCLHRYLPITSR